ncbi:hypothetical protein RHGRI_007507 [Rhododendron griersonianum]|uniref:Uncharacterized protein n=1 Tax=Rhododendron griersonianum TaxID=479676 RepID=A0AAV6KYD4_9ERIC|nr:hypothetical protein RHGRI_007507 [Rhododendron griersonianum]
MRVGQATYCQLTSLQAFWPGIQVFTGSSDVAPHRKVLSSAPELAKSTFCLYHATKGKLISYSDSICSWLLCGGMNLQLCATNSKLEVVVLWLSWLCSIT